MMAMVDVIELALGAFAIGATVGAVGVLAAIAYATRTRRAGKGRRP